MRLKNRAETKKRLSASLRSLSFSLKAQTAPEGLYASVFKGNTYCSFQSTLQRGEVGSNASILLPQRKGTDLSSARNQKRTNMCGCSRYGLSRQNSKSIFAFLILLQETQK